MVDTVTEIAAVLVFVAVLVLSVIVFAIGKFTVWIGIQAAAVMWQSVALFLQAYFAKKIEKK